MITMAIVIIRTNSSSKALAYLLVILALPIVGIILYFSVGVNYRKQKLYKKKLNIDQQKLQEIQTKVEHYRAKLLETETQKIQHFAQLAYNSHYDSLISGGNLAELLINGEQKFPKLLQDLRNAKHHIHIEYYIYENDVIGNEIAEILIQKAKEGVKVRFTYDDFGSNRLTEKFKKLLKHSGVEAVPFYKIKWWLFANGINYRNHRKIVVIDGKIGYVGGINISDKYINNGKNKLFWRDTHVRIEGFAINSLQLAFLVDWNFCAQQNLGYSEDYFFTEKREMFKADHLVQIVSSGPDSDFPNIMFAMIQAIMLSKKKILITTPYFIPESSFINALKIAKLSGVEIKILVPGISDSAFVNAISNSYYEELLEIGIEIYKYQKGFVHAKTMVCDDLISFVGTANLDQRSFDLNFEIHSIVYDEVVAKKHAAVIEKDFMDSEKLNLEDWLKRSKLKFFTERTARLLSPLM